MDEVKPKSIKVKAARINSGLSQEEAARKLHMTVNQLQYVENVPDKLKLKTAWAMSELYNIPVWAFAP